MDEKQDAPMTLHERSKKLGEEVITNLEKYPDLSRELRQVFLMDTFRYSLGAAGRQADGVHQKRVDNIKTQCADHTRTHNALRELCRQRGTALEEQSPCGEDIVLWADAVMRELDTDLDQAIAWVREREDEWDDEKDALLSAMVERRREDLKATTRIRSTALDEIAAEHGREVEKLLSGHYTAQKTPAECIAALTADALAKAGAIWEKRLDELAAEGARLAEQGKALEDQLKNRN